LTEKIKKVFKKINLNQFWVVEVIGSVPKADKNKDQFTAEWNPQVGYLSNSL
jgi:hypothetical protein